MPEQMGWNEGTLHADEDALIAHLAELVDGGSVDVLQGIGDDAAVIAPDLVWTVDTQVEGVHFTRDHSSPYDVGWKALAVNLSDLAAMGAVPVGALVSLILGPDDALGLEPLYAGLGACARTYGCPIVGGDVTRGQGFAISITALGRAATKPPGRAGATPGDVLAVTGTLAESAAGLAVLRDPQLRDVPGAVECSERHRRPHPRLAEGAVLAPIVHAMMDLSDGIATDVRRFARRSGVHIVVDLDALPMHEDIVPIAQAIGVIPGVLAATGGEDYELLVAMAAADVASCGVPLTVIGSVSAGPAAVRFVGAGADAALRGWDHLAG